MTYRDLLAQLSALTPEQLDSELQVLTSEGAVTGRLEVKVADGTDWLLPKGSIYIDA